AVAGRGGGGGVIASATGAGRWIERPDPGGESAGSGERGRRPAPNDHAGLHRDDEDSAQGGAALRWPRRSRSRAGHDREPDARATSLAGAERPRQAARVLRGRTWRPALEDRGWRRWRRALERTDCRRLPRVLPAHRARAGR